jgi:threonine/homoserine/homoserine lactone efflux protein
MNISLFLTYLLTLTVLMLTPGPDMLFCLASGLKGGPRSGFAAALGAASGEVVHITAAAVGLAALFRSAPFVFNCVRILGAAYLVWLGMRALHRRDERLGGRTEAGAAARRAYGRGLLTNLLNPKMVLFSMAFLPQFVDPHAGNVAVQFVLLGACFVVLEIAIDGTIGIVAGRVARLLRGRRTNRNLNLTAGSIYLGLGAKVALER